MAIVKNVKQPVQFRLHACEKLTTPSTIHRSLTSYKSQMYEQDREIEKYLTLFDFSLKK